ncbi:MAG TPA: hypothetical protein VH500_17820 [Nitrososphaeraceae archaeon]|jgi:hypothetical protein
MKVNLLYENNNNLHQQLLFLAKTDANTRITHMVADSDCLDDFKNGWDYTLGHFIELYKEALQQCSQEHCSKIEPIHYYTIYRSSPTDLFDGAMNEAKNIQKQNKDTIILE